MNVKQCYLQFGGDYESVLGRLRREQLVEKFLLKFLEDKSFAQFEAAMVSRNYEEGLRAVHTLKGICQNLSFTDLYDSSSQITRAMKERNYEKAIELAPRLSEDYYRIVRAVEEYRRSMEG